LGLSDRKQQKLVTSSFTICTAQKYYQGGQIKKGVR